MYLLANGWQRSLKATYKASHCVSVPLAMSSPDEDQPRSGSSRQEGTPLQDAGGSELPLHLGDRILIAGEPRPSFTFEVRGTHHRHRPAPHRLDIRGPTSEQPC